jgi:hypothetical protein
MDEMYTTYVVYDVNKRQQLSKPILVGAQQRHTQDSCATSQSA